MEKIKNAKIILIILFLILFNSYFNLYSQNDNALEFFSAIENGNIEIVKEIIKSGIDINIADKDNWSALHRAVQVNKIEIVKELLSHKKIDINPVLPEGTILDNNGKKWFADGETPLLLASFYGYSDIVLLLLNYGANILSKDDIDGAMAIHIAVARGNTETVSAILESYSARNKNIANVSDNTGTTPLMWAAMNNQISVMNLLLKFDADIDAQDDDGWTALHFAAASESYKAAELLINNKANVDIKNLDDKKPIDIASDSDIQALLNKYIKDR